LYSFEKYLCSCWKEVAEIRSITAMSDELIPPAKPYFPRADIEEMKVHLDKILTSGMLTLGEYTRDFERQFAAGLNVKHAVAVNSGTSALEVALRAHRLKLGDEVIVPTNTFGATAAATVFAGGRPVITDVCRESLTINLEIVKSAVTKRTKGVMAVHIGGLICPEIESIREFCDER